MTKSNPLVSIIVTIYNIEQYVPQCIETILNQTYNNIEVLLIDDGSTDNSGLICEQYTKIDNRILLIKQDNQGLSEARNTGLSACRGKYVIFVDGDDWIDLNMTEVLISAVLRNEAEACCCGFTIESNDHQSKHPVAINEAACSGIEGLNSILNGQTNEQVWNKIWKRELFDSVTFPKGCNYEDVATVWRLLLKCNTFVVIPDICYHYRLREGSITNRKAAENRFEHWQNAKERLDAVSSIDEKLFIPGLRSCLYSAIVIWKNTFSFSEEVKKNNRNKYEEISTFIRKHERNILLSNYDLYMKAGSLFVCNNSRMSFACCFCIGAVYHTVKLLLIRIKTILKK